LFFTMFEMGPNSNCMFDRTVPNVIVKASFFDVLSVATIFDRKEDTVLEVGACIAVIFVELWPYLVIRSILLFPCWILNLLKENPLLVYSEHIAITYVTTGDHIVYGPSILQPHFKPNHRIAKDLRVLIPYLKMGRVYRH